MSRRAAPIVVWTDPALLPPVPPAVLLITAEQYASQQVTVIFDTDLSTAPTLNTAFVLDGEEEHGGPWTSTNVGEYGASSFIVTFGTAPTDTLYIDWQIQMIADPGATWNGDATIQSLPQTLLTDTTPIEINVLQVVGADPTNVTWEFDQTVTVTVPDQPSQQLELDPLLGPFIGATEITQVSTTQINAYYEGVTLTTGDPWRVDAYPENITEGWRIAIPAAGNLLAL